MNINREHTCCVFLLIFFSIFVSFSHFFPSLSTKYIMKVLCLAIKQIATVCSSSIKSNCHWMNVCLFTHSLTQIFFFFIFIFFFKYVYTFFFYDKSTIKLYTLQKLQFNLIVIFITIKMMREYVRVLVALLKL